MDYFDLLETVQVKAIHAALKPSVEYLWRQKCRLYSERFNTPLHEVHELDPEFVLQALYEEKYSPEWVKDNLDEVLDMLYRIRDPHYKEMEDAEIEDLVDAVLMKEMKRKNEKRTTNEIVSLPGNNQQPTSGGMKFDMERSDQISEFGQQGFKD